MRRLIASCTLILLATACGSGKDAAETSAQTSATSTVAPATAGGADDVSQWFETETAPPAPASDTSAALADPDAVIARYKRECPAGTKSPECRARRLDVEAIFLDVLVAVRKTNEIVDPRWYRLAAASETPQLACIGLVELIWDPKRTAEDEALITRALDSPYRGVRGAVVLNAGKLPALAETLRRSGGVDYRELTGVCLDDSRDPVPGAKWAGSYPNAQFRAHASNAERRWFTTPDTPEKVIGWFEARGKRARTSQQLAEDAQARFMEAMTKLSENAEEDYHKKMMALMATQGADAQWSQPFSNMEGIGEVRYVMIGASQAIAIFRDDLLKATSIVANQPVQPSDLTPDLEAAREEAEVRTIFRY